MAGIIIFLIALAIALSTHFQHVAAAIIVTGAQGGIDSLSGVRPARQDITMFQSSGPPMDLFIQAFQMFEQDDQRNVLSFYEVSGIHGFPFKAWDGVGGSIPAGYCTHNSVLFPTWHRAYVALYEQIIWGYAQTIAANYPSELRATYQKAAVNLRVPYWDWALTPTMPTSCTRPQITIRTPSGNRTIQNPLYSYNFHPLPLGTDFPLNQNFSHFPTSVRNPDQFQNSQNSKSNADLLANGPVIHSLTYQLLTAERNYTKFASGAVGGYQSLENLHNLIHTLVGGNGHMGFIPWSAFDPIFWLHHASVDRLFALWQIINPDSFIEDSPTMENTFTRPSGVIVNANSALTPFHATLNAYHSSYSIRSTKIFGYTYPEIIDWNISRIQLAANVRKNINALYNPTIASSKKRSINQIDGRSDSGANQHTNVGISESDEKGINNLPIQWTATFEVDKFILSAPFLIHFFLAPPPTDPSLWSTCRQHIGTGTIFSMVNTTAQQPTIIYGQVPLTHALQAAVEGGLLPSLKPGRVVPLLTRRLEWRIQLLDKTPVDTNKLVIGKGEGALRVAVASRDVQPRVVDDEFPAYGAWVQYPGATAGKVGGK